MLKARNYLVSGRVQGVYFRACTQDAARDLGLTGFVRNLPDGRVEVFAQGTEERLGRLEEFLRSGSPAARVDGVEGNEAEPRTLDGFEIEY
jgi:acylphosphatase